MQNQTALGRNEAIYWPATTKLPATQPALKPVYRRAGRKKLTPAQIADRDQYLSDLKQQNAERRAAERQKRRDQKERAAELKMQRRQELQEQARRREQLQAIFNRNAIVEQRPEPMEPVVTGAASRLGVLAVTNTPALPGQTAVRINARTVINVKAGRDINEAIAHYKIKHNLV